MNSLHLPPNLRYHVFQNSRIEFCGETTVKTAAEISEHLHGRVLGDFSVPIEDVSSLEKASSNSLVWVDSEKNLVRAMTSAAPVILLPESLVSRMGSLRMPDCKPKTFIVVSNPRLAFAQAISLFHPPRPICSGIDRTAQIAPTAQVGDGVSIGACAVIEDHAVVGNGCEIGAGSFVGEGVRMGCDCRLYPHVTLCRDITIGHRCVFYSGVVVGSDGFGFVPEKGRYHKFPQIGTVIIGDDVEIGANTTIDRGALDATRIGRGTKIDNLVQIAHNVEIGEDVVIAAQTGISGGTIIEDHCVIGGQVGMGDHARVKRGAVVGSKGGILPGKIIREGEVVWGIPAIPLDEYKVLNALWRGLPKLKEEVQALKKATGSEYRKGPSGNRGRKSSSKKAATKRRRKANS